MDIKDTKLDQWAQWLLHTRHGGDESRLQAVLAALYPIRDRVLNNAALHGEEILLDVGCGDGLIGFGALTQLPAGQVIFSDISQDLLAHTNSVAEQMQVLERVQFVLASAADLAPIADKSVDVVTIRSVLIYVKAKQQAFNNFYRVLVPGGRLSLFEPINRFGHPQPDHLFWGYDVTPVISLGRRIRAIYEDIQPLDDPMLDFDEHDLLKMTEEAGFTEIHLEIHWDILPEQKWSSGGWEAFIHLAPNPRVPTLQEAMREALSEEEIKRFIDHLRPMVENAAAHQRAAVAYLWATKY